MRRLYDKHLTGGTQFSVQDLEISDPYDMFDDFKSFQGYCICILM